MTEVQARAIELGVSRHSAYSPLWRLLVFIAILGLDREFGWNHDDVVYAEYRIKGRML